MATTHEIEDTLGGILAAALYPSGTASQSAVGFAVKLHRGWPQAQELNDALNNGHGRLTVNRARGRTRDVTRYRRDWVPGVSEPATLTATVTGYSTTYGGTATAGEVAGAMVGGVGYTYAVQAADTASSVAAGVVAAINAPGLVLAAAAGPTVSASLAGVAIPVLGRVAGIGTATREIGRTEQGFWISVFAPSIEARDEIEDVAMAALRGVDRLSLSNGLTGPLKFVTYHQNDTGENANLYRSDLVWSVEYAETETMTGAEMLFGVGTLTAAGTLGEFTFGFGVLALPTPLVIPPLGAIRFDAWYDPANTIDAQSAAALSPVAWNPRLPPNATVKAGVASWPLATQATIDAEIIAAKVAGLSFWAFDSYAPGDTLSLALQLYLTSSLRRTLGFAMVGQSSSWGDPAGADGYSATLHRDILMMTQAGYQSVGGRPIYFMLDASADQTSNLPAGGVPAAIAYVRAAVTLAGGGNPYVVYLSGAALADYDNVPSAMLVGADAAGSYATPRLNGTPQVYSALAASAATDWTQRASAGMPMVPCAMTGWDQRPLIETPQPYYPISAALSMTNYYATATAAEIAAHVVSMAQWIAANEPACPAQFGLVYAWNELAEGGWMMPTYAGSLPDTSRCATTGAALVAAVIASQAPSIALIS